MKYFILIALSLFLIPENAWAGKRKDCRLQSEVVGHLELLRQSNLDLDASKSAVTAQLQEEGHKYVAAVDPLADWVWSLSDAELTDGVSRVWYDACMSQ